MSQIRDRGLLGWGLGADSNFQILYYGVPQDFEVINANITRMQAVRRLL